MPWTPQSEATFRDRIVRINRSEMRRTRKRGGALRAALKVVMIAGLFLVGAKTLVLSDVSEGAFRQAALDLHQDGPAGMVLATIFGPDPISTELSRHLRF